MKNYKAKIRNGVFLIFLLIGISSCQKEEIETLTENSSSVEKGTITNRVNAKDIPALENFVASKMKGLPQKSSGNGTYVETSFGQIPLENITEVIDLDGNTNYTFKVYPNNPEPNTFYNLIVNPSQDGSDLVAFVLEYKMTKELANGLFFGSKTMDEFEGEINKYSLDTFLNSSIAKSADLPCPCSEVNISNSNTLGGTGGGSGSGEDSGDSDNSGNDGGDPYNNGSSTGGTNAGGGGCKIRLVIECRGSRDLPPWWPQGSNCMTTGIIIDCPANKSNIEKTSDCPISDTGDCPNNNGEFGVDDYELVEFLNITDQSTRMRLLFDPNQDLVDACGNFLWNFRDDPDQLETAKASTIEIINQFFNNIITKQDAINLLESAESIESVKVVAEISSALSQELIDEDQANELFAFLQENQSSKESIAEVKLTIKSLSNVTPWESASGMIDGNNNLEYNETRVWSINGEDITEFKLLNGDRIARGNYNICSGCQGNEDKTFYRQKESSEWFEFVSRPSTFQKSDLDFIFDSFWDGAKFVGRWIIPVEDVIILVGGTNFDGESENQYLAGGMLFVSVIPGGKLLKPVTKVVSGTNTWKVISRAGTQLAEASYGRFANAVQDGVVSKIDDLFRSGDVAVDVLEETAEKIVDVSEKKGRKLSWEEIKALFKRGNDFNKKAVNNEWYDYHEIHLSNGKRLDSYDPIIGEIVSRKATDLSNIKFSTFENYLKEMQQKYRSGTRIRSNKYPDLDGQLLQGQQILEIPASNQSLPNIQTFINFARDNYNIIIRFRPE